MIFIEIYVLLVEKVVEVKKVFGLLVLLIFVRLNMWNDKVGV